MLARCSMKTHIGVAMIGAALVFSGCAAVPGAEPVSVTTLTSAEVEAPAHAYSATPSWWAEDPWGPSVSQRVAPLPTEDPWSSAPPPPPPAPVTAWGGPSGHEIILTRTR